MAKAKDDPSVEGEYIETDRPKRSAEAIEYVGRIQVLERMWSALRVLGVTEDRAGRHELWPIFEVIADAYDAGVEGNPFRDFAEWTEDPKKWICDPRDLQREFDEAMQSQYRDISDEITRMDTVQRSIYDVVPAGHRRRALK